jgi:hypothetical protein
MSRPTAREVTFCQCDGSDFHVTAYVLHTKWNETQLEQLRKEFEASMCVRRDEYDLKDVETLVRCWHETYTADVEYCFYVSELPYIRPLKEGETHKAWFGKDRLKYVDWSRVLNAAELKLSE